MGAETTLVPCSTRPAKEFMQLLSKLRQISIECDWKRAIFPVREVLRTATRSNKYSVSIPPRLFFFLFDITEIQPVTKPAAATLFNRR